MAEKKGLQILNQIVYIHRKLYSPQNCDWLVQFLDECCDVGKDYKAPSGRTYDTYKYFCSQSGNVPLNQHKFNEVLGNAGFDKKRCNGSQFFYGLKLKQYETV